MRLTLITTMALVLVSATALAQRDPPVWESYLCPIEVYHADRLTTSIDFDWVKDGGAHEHRQHVIYLLGYLEKKEAEILALMRDENLMRKGSYEGADGKPCTDKILDVLLAKKLVTVLARKVVDRLPTERPEEKPHLADRNYVFRFEAEFQNGALFEKISALPGFETPKPSPEKQYLRDDFKVMPFIPVNDSKYADDIAPDKKTTYDFTQGEGYGGERSWIAQYLRPLPYVFNMARLGDGNVLIYLH